MGSYTKDEPTNHNANDEILQPVVRAGKQVQTNENCCFFFSLFVCIISLVDEVYGNHATVLRPCRQLLCTVKDSYLKITCG